MPKLHTVCLLELSVCVLHETIIAQPQTAHYTQHRLVDVHQHPYRIFGSWQAALADPAVADLLRLADAITIASSTACIDLKRTH